jgi:hypothetical protein
VGTLKAKGDNPDRKSWSPRLGVGAVGRLPTHHKNIQMLKDLKISKRYVFRLKKPVYSRKIPKINKIKKIFWNIVGGFHGVENKYMFIPYSTFL